MDPDFLFASDADAHGAGRRSLALRCRSGELVRVRAGVYVHANAWHALAPWERERALARAVADRGRGTRVLIQESAAAMWGLPVIGPRTEVLLLAVPPAHARTRGDVRWAARRLLEPTVVVDGVAVTSRAQTVVDMAAYLDFERAVPAADSALRPDPARDMPPLSSSRLRELAENLPSQARRLRARRVIDFADPRSESPGESFSRAVIARLGFPPPVLQHRFDTAAGRFRADFFWRQENLVGEFDGAVKYGRGEAPVAPSWDTLVKEKRREDAIRATGAGLVRWSWSDLGRPGHDPESLLLRLLRAGLPRSRRL